MAAGEARASKTPRLNRFTSIRDPVYHVRPMEPLVHVPVAPGASFHLPPKLEGLRRLAYNLWWSWHPQARVLFSRIDAGAWARYRNPIPVLSGPVAWDQLFGNRGSRPGNTTSSRSSTRTWRTARTTGSRGA